jgi:hypothetical protein
MAVETLTVTTTAPRNLDKLGHHQKMTPNPLLR